MIFNRRTLLRFGAVGAASLALPDRLRTWRAQRFATLDSVLFTPLATHTYEEGVEGGLVPIGEGVLGTGGLPVYSAASAVHENMGWISAGASHGGRLSYQNPTSAGSAGSVYLTPGGFATNGTATVVAFAHALGEGALLAKV